MTLPNTLERLRTLVNAFERKHDRLPSVIRMNRVTRLDWQFQTAIEHANPWTSAIYPKKYRDVPVVVDETLNDGFIEMGDS